MQHMDKNLFNNFVDTVDDPRKKVNDQVVMLVETTGTHAFRRSSAHLAECVFTIALQFI